MISQAGVKKKPKTFQ